MIFKKLKEKQGSMSALSLATVLSMLLIVTGTAEYFRLKTITSHIEDTIQSAVINIAIENYENVYSSNREAYTSGQTYDDSQSQWKEVLNNGDILKQVSETLGLEEDGDSYIKETSGTYEYKISNLNIQFESPSLQSDKSDKFIAKSKIDFEMPHKFSWKHLAPLKLKLKVKSEYMPMF